ncbi:MAG: head-tail connector protein [Rhizobiaceae bacterium]
MTLFRTVEPALEPVTLVEAKTHLRVGHDSEDPLISALVRAAREEVERSTGLALIAQSWRLTLDDWPLSETVAINLHPLAAILSVTVYGEDGEAAVLDPATYLLDPHSRPARLALRERPAPHKAMNGVEIDLSAGFGEAGADVPDLLRRAILVLVAHWYEFRGHVDPDAHPLSYPAGYERLISGYRSRRL